MIPLSQIVLRCCIHIVKGTEAKPGGREKRKKGASFQTVSQLHKVGKSEEIRRRDTV